MNKCDSKYTFDFVTGEALECDVETDKSYHGNRISPHAAYYGGKRWKWRTKEQDEGLTTDYKLDTAPYIKNARN